MLVSLSSLFSSGHAATFRTLQLEGRVVPQRAWAGGDQEKKVVGLVKKHRFNRARLALLREICLYCSDSKNVLTLLGADLNRPAADLVPT